MANTLTPLQIVNQAFRHLAEKPITSFMDTTNPRSLLANQFYATVRDDCLVEHFWNWATTRVVLLPYTEPAATITPAAVTGTGIVFLASTVGVFGLDAVGKRIVGDGVPGDATISALVSTSPAATLTPAAGALIPEQTGVVFTAGAAVFVLADVGKIIENLGGLGVARITAFTDASNVVATILSAWDVTTAMASGAWQLVDTDQVLADITEDFAAVAPIAAGDWRLYHQAPAWGFTHSMAVPTDCLRIQRTDESRIYQREGDYLITDEESLPLTYCARVTDVTRYSPAFVQWLVAELCVAFTGAIADLTPKRELWIKLADLRKRKAKKDDGQEGSSPQVTASDLVAARRGGHPGWPRRRFPF